MAGTIRTLLVDDEEPARVRLRSLLGEFEAVEIVAEARDGQEALEKIRDVRPDLVFLDIEMPGMSGLEVAASLEPPRPRVIFCTAFDQYAIDAFEHHATDYLLKPVSKKRLTRTVERIGVALAEQRLQSREMDTASRTQERLLPQQLPPMLNLDYAGVCRAARGVGGDCYDFLPLPDNRLGLVLGDVSGKGLFAGLLMAALQARLQALAPRYGDAVGELVTETNRLMHGSIDANRYATLFYGVFDDATRTLRYVNAGHLPPLLLCLETDGGVARRLEANGTVVGLLPHAAYETRTLDLAPGDLLVLYSDGVTEARDPAGNEFGETALESLARRHAELPAGALRDALLAAVETFAGSTEAHDDITLVVAKVR